MKKIGVYLRYGILLCLDVLSVMGLWLALVLFGDASITKDSMLYFTVADYYQMFGLPFMAIVHGILSRLMTRSFFKPHIGYLFILWLGISIVRPWHLFSIETWICTLTAVVLSCLFSWITVGVQNLLNEINKY